MHTLRIMQKYKSLLTCPSVLPVAITFSMPYTAQRFLCLDSSLRDLRERSLRSSVTSNLFVSTHRHFVKLLLVISVGKLFTVGYRSTAVALECESDLWLTVHRNSVRIRKTNWMSLFVFFISLLIVAQHVSGNHVPIIRS